MSTLIIPCCGNSKINGIPNWLNKHPNGNYLINECIRDSQVLEIHRIIIPILKEDDIRFNAKAALTKIVSNVLPLPEILILEDKTKGPADTVYQTIRRASVSGPVVVRDSDVHLQFKSVVYPNFIVGIDLMDCSDEMPNIKNKAFLKVNENDIVLDVIEKQVCSNKVCFGMYGFESHSDYISSYEALRDFNYDMGDLYVSNVIAYLIGVRSLIFSYIKATEYEDWDSYQSWLGLRHRYSSYFINADLPELLTAFPKLEALCENGAQLVFYSSQPEKNRGDIEEMLSHCGVKVDDIIMGCLCGERRIINTAGQLAELGMN